MNIIVNPKSTVLRKLPISSLRVLPLNIFVLSCFLALNGLVHGQMTGISFEVDTAFYAPGEDAFAPLEGYVTYDIFANFTNPADKLISIYSDVGANGDSPMYINAPCGCFNPGFGDVLLGANQNQALFSFFPDVEYDTYWTVGFSSGEGITSTNPSYSSTTMCFEQISDGAFYPIPTNAPEAGDDLQIQIAQVTTCGALEISACFQVFVNGSNSNQQFWCIDADGDGDDPFVIENPCEGYLQTDAQVDVIENIDCFGDLAEVDVIVNGVSPITYELYNAIDGSLVTSQVDDNNFAGLLEGEYFVAIIDDNTCRDSTDTFSFIQPEELSPTWELVQDNICPGELNSIISLNFQGGTGPFDIVAYASGSSANGQFPNAQNEWIGLPCPNGNGSWDFQIEDANGCYADTTITLSCIEPLILDVEGEDITCFDYNDGMISGFMSGGTGNLVLAGSPNLGVNISGEGYVDIDINNLGPADYLLVVTDANGCEVSTNLPLIEPAPVSIILEAFDLNCAEICDGSVMIEATGGSGNFDYSVTDLEALEWEADELCAGDYFANATDANGCVVQESFTILAPDSILFDLLVNDVTCNGEANGSICVENASGGTGSLVYQVDPPAGAYTTETCFDLPAGTFVISVMDDAGCVVSSNPTLLIEPDPIQLILTSTEISCTSYADGTLEVQGIGGTGTLILVEPESGDLPYVLENLDEGLTEVTVQDDNGCLQVGEAEIFEPDSLMVEWLLLENVVCGGDCDGSAIIDFEGGTGAVQLTLNGAEDFNFAALCAGFYTANVIDANGCEDSTQFEILEPDPIEVLINVTDVTCTGMNDGEVNIFPIGGTGPLTWEVLEQGIDLLNLYEGLYNITAIDSTGCVEDTTFTVAAEEDTDMIINMLSSPVTCWNEQDGTATASVVGGHLPIEYLWSDVLAQTTPTATGLYEDTYSVVVTDSLGCTLTRVVTVDPTIGCFFIAEAITPNGDGYNDEWIVGGLEWFPTAKVSVFNRWGQQLFMSIGYKERWDGRYNNAPLPMADYYYVIEFADDKDPITGTVTLKY